MHLTLQNRKFYIYIKAKYYKHIVRNVMGTAGFACLNPSPC